jgi:hypothetical protein
MDANVSIISKPATILIFHSHPKVFNTDIWSKPHGLENEGTDGKNLHL